MSKEDTERKYTLTMSGLTRSEAIEIAENGNTLMWGEEDGNIVAYPRSGDHPAIISEF